MSAAERVVVLGGGIGGLTAAYELSDPKLEGRYEAVIVDTPPVLLVPDARQILERVAVCVPVARAGTTRVRAFRSMLEEIPRSQVLSTLLNGKRGGDRYYQNYPYQDEPVGPASR